MSKASSIKLINISIYQDHFLPADVNGIQFFLVHWTLKVISLIKDQDFFNAGRGGSENDSEFRGGLMEFFPFAFRMAGRQILIIIYLVIIILCFKLYPKRKQKISGWNFFMEWVLGHICLNWQNFKTVKSLKTLRGGDFLKCYEVIAPRIFSASTEN